MRAAHSSQVKSAEATTNGAEKDAVKKELDEMRVEFNDFKKSALQDSASFEDQIDSLKQQLRNANNSCVLDYSPTGTADDGEIWDKGPPWNEEVLPRVLVD